jgi:hypothetical protein
MATCSRLCVVPTLRRIRDEPRSEMVGISVGESVTGSTKGRLGATLTGGRVPSESKNPGVRVIVLMKTSLFNYKLIEKKVKIIAKNKKTFV